MEEEETEVRRNLEALFSSEIETAFESVLTMERSLVSLVDDKSRSNPVLIFRDESSEMGVFELVLELALHEGYPSPLYLSAESCDTVDVNQLVGDSNSHDVIKIGLNEFVTSENLHKRLRSEGKSGLVGSEFDSRS